MSECQEFKHAIAYDHIHPEDLDGVIPPGLRAKDMRPYLESNGLQSCPNFSREISR